MPQARGTTLQARIEMAFSFGVARLAGRLKVLPSLRRGEVAPEATEGGQQSDIRNQLATAQLTSGTSSSYSYASRRYASAELLPLRQWETLRVILLLAVVTLSGCSVPVRTGDADLGKPDPHASVPILDSRDLASRSGKWSSRSTDEGITGQGRWNEVLPPKGSLKSIERKSDLILSGERRFSVACVDLGSGLPILALALVECNEDGSYDRRLILDHPWHDALSGDLARVNVIGSVVQVSSGKGSSDPMEEYTVVTLLPDLASLPRE